MLGSLVGGTVGGFGWVVLFGIANRSLLMTGVPLIVGAICVTVGMRLFDARPQRQFAIAGLAELWIVLFDLLFVNLWYDKIPETLAGITTGKAQWSLLSLNLFLLVFSMLGFACVIKDILNSHKKA